ncbi:Six-hairpin glycosidase, partial [Auricularia subglabra TFB-10046 SS5]
RLRLTFGEVVRDVAEDFAPPSKGWLAESWLPQEVVNVDFMPHLLRMSRRQAFRYVKVEVLATSDNFDVALEDAQAESVTSMPANALPPALTRASFSGSDLELGNEDVDMLIQVDKVAIATLKSCMQTVLEDGPRRDRRLWLGDLRVQALTCYSLGLPDYSLIKRCILLHAALPYNASGRVAACIFENPEPHAGNNFILDYSLLFAVTINEYVDASGDEALGRELFDIATKQLEIALAFVDDRWLFADPGGIWLVEDLDRQAATQGVLIIACHALASLARRLEIAPSASRGCSTLPLSEVADKLTEAARTHLWDADRRLFISGPKKQVSLASNAWLVLANAIPPDSEGAECMNILLDAPDAVKPKTPYGHHYVVEALLHIGMRADALRYIARYWGSMVKAGADTFFEAWDPQDPRFSPYSDAHVNSYCHGWSCTPSYLLRARLGLK